jgi:hypothetical protein
VNRQRVCEFEALITILPEVRPTEAELETELGRELDLQLPGQSLRLPVPPLILPDNESDLSVRDVCLLKFGKNVVAATVLEIDDLIAVENSLASHRLGDLAIPVWFGFCPAPYRRTEQPFDPTI